MQAQLSAANQRLTSRLAAAAEAAETAKQEQPAALADAESQQQSEVAAISGELGAARRQAALTDGLCDRLQVRCQGVRHENLAWCFISFEHHTGAC